MQIPNIEHPEFEVHDAWTLGERLGCHGTNVTILLQLGRIKLLCSNFRKWKNIFVVSKNEIERLIKERDDKLSLRAERKKQEALDKKSRKKQREAKKKAKEKEAKKKPKKTTA